MCFDLQLHSRGHHDDTDDGDQQEVQSVHDAGPCGLLDLGTAVAAAGAGRRAAAAGHLHTAQTQNHQNLSPHYNSQQKQSYLWSLWITEEQDI